MEQPGPTKEGVFSAPQNSGLNPPLHSTLDFFTNKSYGRGEDNNFSMSMNIGQGLYLDIFNHETQKDKFVPLYPDKLLDVNGTPLPPSYGGEIFDVQKHERLWKGKNAYEEIISSSKIVKARLKKLRTDHIQNNKINYHVKRNGVGVVQGFCECTEERNMPPCNIIHDLLDIKPTEFKKITSGRSWGGRPNLKVKSRTKLNFEYEKKKLSCAKE